VKKMRRKMARRSNAERAKIARGIRNIRAADRGYRLRIRKFGDRTAVKFLPHEWFLRRGLEDYNKRIFGIFSRENIAKLLRNELKAKRRLSILDAGCGTCEFLGELRKLFGEKLELEGITLARPLTVKQLERLEKKLKEEKALTENAKEHIERLKKLREEFERRVREADIKVRVGAVESYKFGKKYDVIFSVGMIVHSSNPWQALENLLNHLKKGGRAYINFGKADILRSPELCWELAGQGIEIRRLSKDSYELVRLSDEPIRIT